MRGHFAMNRGGHFEWILHTIYEIERERFDILDEEETIGEIVRILKNAGSNLTDIGIDNRDFGEFSISLYILYKPYPPYMVCLNMEKNNAAKIIGNTPVINAHIFLCPLLLRLKLSTHTWMRYLV